jgi:hypothetical protein
MLILSELFARALPKVLDRQLKMCSLKAPNRERQPKVLDREGGPFHKKPI